MMILQDVLCQSFIGRAFEMRKKNVFIGVVILEETGTMLAGVAMKKYQPGRRFGCMDERTDRRMDGWTDGRTDRRVLQ